jgi:HK97 family phage major capsid protein
MTEAHANDNNDAFTSAETELRTLDEKIARARKVEALERAEPGQVINGDAKLDAEIRSKFSLCRAIAGRFDNTVDDGFEREVQAELAKRAGKPAEGFYIPTEIFEKRVLTTSTANEVVSTDHRPDLYISALTNASVIRSMGATVLPGLVGNLSIPRETDSPAVGWVAENAAITSDDANFDAVTLSPKHAGALTEYSRNMLLQSSPAVEQLLRNMLARNLALAIDAAAIKGGGSNEPTGILATSGIQTYSIDQAGGEFLGDAFAEMIALADIANVDARRAFLTTMGVKKDLLKSKDGEGQYMPIAQITHGEPITFSNQVPTNGGVGTNDHGIIYGDFSELLLGVWSEVDILVNPYEATAYSKGNVKLRAMATVDCAVRHAAAFVSGTDYTPA